MAIVYDEQAAREIEQVYQTPDVVRQRLAVLSKLSLELGESVLDVGCGTGLLLEMLAKAVDASGQACGIDSSEDMLAFARHRCSDLPQVKLQHGGVEQLDFPEQSFDAIACTQVLLYVDNTSRALAEMNRVIKPGGRLVIVETDWDGAVMNSDNPELTRRIFDCWDTAVSSPNLPRRLKPMLLHAGFNHVQVDAVPIINTQFSHNEFSRSMTDSFTGIAVKNKAISAEEADQWQAGLRRLAANGEYFFAVNRFVFSAVK